MRATASVLGLALVDSLNPSIILMTLFLLSTPRPVPRTASYIAAVYLTNLTLGLLVYFGLGAALTLLIERLTSSTDWWIYALQFCAALGMLAAAYILRPAGEDAPSQPPRSIHPRATFLLGIGATFVEFTTAAPYLGSIALLTKADIPAMQALLTLALYNVVYVGIPLSLLGLYLLRRERAERIFGIIRERTRRWVNILLRVLLAAGGLILLVDVVGWVLGSPLIA